MWDCTTVFPIKFFPKTYNILNNVTILPLLLTSQQTSF